MGHKTKKMCVRVFLTAMLGIFSMFTLSAQSGSGITVKGNVKDKQGEPVIGASIIVVGTTAGTITDLDGNYSVNAPANGTLEIKYLGYKTQVIPIQNRPTISITLLEDSELLGEVIVIGYGTVKKDDATGSVTAIRPDEMSKGITTSAQDMLAGKVAGVSVLSNDGTPGGGAQIRIRGGSSLNATNDPLIVIDGLTMDNDGVKGMSNALAFVNPNDIETFTVLKDASATAIYGSRASNGVILITTKKGKAGAKPSINYNGNMSIGIKRNTLDVMSGDEYRAYVTNLYQEAGQDIPAPLGTANTDWQDEIYQTAISHDHNVTISGGIKSVPYRVSLGYTNQEGILKTSKFERYTASVNLAPSLFNDHLKLTFNAKAMVADSRFAETGAVGSAAAMDPTRPVYDATLDKFGGYYQSQQGNEYNDPNWSYGPNSNAPQNPLALLKLKNKKASSQTYIGNIEVDYKLHFFPDLRVHANLAGDYSDGDEKEKISPYSYSNHYYGWNGTTYEYKYNLLGNIYAQYTKELDLHFFDVMAGAEQQHFHRNGYNVGLGINPLTGEHKNEIFRDEVDGVKGTAFVKRNSLVSYFGRLNYTYDNKYLLTATVRRDGTSRFSEDNRWATFPSIALAWKMKEESFLKDVNVLSDLKLRLGWGITGQQVISDRDFPYLPQFVNNQTGATYPFDEEYYPTLRPEEYNKNLKWEETSTWNAGVDFGFLNGRITGAIDYYYRETKDLISVIDIPAMTNFKLQMPTNIGTLENRGVEFSVSGKPVVTKDWTWDLSYNLSYNKNKITELAGGDDPNYYVVANDRGISKGTGSSVEVHKVGYAAYSYYVYQQVYDDNGKPIEGMFVDRDGDGTITDDDRYIYKKPAGDVEMGLTSKLIYKNWDFSFSLRASLNNYVYNDVLASNSNVSVDNGVYSPLGFYVNRPIDAVNLGFANKTNAFMSDYFVQNASFLRCDNITLGYSFSNFMKTSKYNGVNGRIYTTVQNPFVITSYDGLDPEIPKGIDRDLYPRPVTFLLGLSLQF